MQPSLQGGKKASQLCSASVISAAASISQALRELYITLSGQDSLKS